MTTHIAKEVRAAIMRHARDKECAMQAIELIEAERTRQIDVEGFDAMHDDGNGFGKLLSAGECYYNHTCRPKQTKYVRKGLKRVPRSWPWYARWWKPTTSQRNLEKAGALALAEIASVDRHLNVLSTLPERTIEKGTRGQAAVMLLGATLAALERVLMEEKGVKFEDGRRLV